MKTKNDYPTSYLKGGWKRKVDCLVCTYPNISTSEIIEELKNGDFIASPLNYKKIRRVVYDYIRRNRSKINTIVRKMQTL